METQPQLDRNDPPSKHTATMAPKPPDAPPVPTAKRSGCGCFKLLVLLAIGVAIWLYFRN